MVVPMAEKKGFARSKASVSPPAMMESVAFFAPTGPPETGASIMAMPAAARSAAMRRTATVSGRQWQVFVGPRGSGGAATGADAGAPVISYITASGTIPNFSFDLKDFIDEAVASGDLNGNFFLTDVFAGFEIWSGGTGLSVTDFTVDVQGNQ